MRQWAKATAILGYIEGQSTSEIAKLVGAGRSTVVKWITAYTKMGFMSLHPRRPPGRPSRLTLEQMEELQQIVRDGPEHAGFHSGIWSARMITELIQRRFGVKYNWKYVPRLLHRLGFSIQRPRKLLSRADHKAQAQWLNERLPAIKEEAHRVGGIVLFEDEASFQLDPTLHRTWAPRGEQPRVPTRGERRTAHVYGAIDLENAYFSYSFAEVFNGSTFLGFLQALVRRYDGRKIFLIIDNGPCHNLNKQGKVWLHEHRDSIELHRLPPYSPELNAVEGIWKTTRRTATHNRFFNTTEERDRSLIRTFRAFQRKPSLVEPHVLRFR